MADTNLIEICCIFDEFCKYFEPKLKSISRFCQYSLIKNGSVFWVHLVLRKSKKQHLARYFYAMMELFFVFFALKAML